MKIAMFAIVATLGLAATSASAAPAGTQTDAKAKPSDRASTDTKRYCIIDTTLGSRIRHKHCNTRAQWAAEGIDIDLPAK